MNKNVSDKEAPPRRRRRTAEVARREILDAAKLRLMEGGPDNVRLKLIGEDVGLSHSSILHHFGSRDGLMEALRNDAFGALARDLAARLEGVLRLGDVGCRRLCGGATHLPFR